MDINTLIKILQDLPEEIKEAEILIGDPGSYVYQHVATEVTIESKSKIYERLTLKEIVDYATIQKSQRKSV